MAEETSSGNDFDPKIMEFMSKNPKGVSNEILLGSMTHVTKDELVDRLNKLIKQHKVQVLLKGTQLVYMLKDSSSIKKYQGADVDEKVIFDAVQKAGNNGVTAKDLKFQCRLPQPQVNKVLKNLKDKMLVKAVVGASGKKLFMMRDQEPSQTVTGGTFYSDQEFESEFVDVLGEQCYRYLIQAKAVADKLSDPMSQRYASYKSSKDICDYINDLKISKVNLGLKDIESILESLVYDEKLEKSVSVSSHSSKDTRTQNLFRVIKPLIGNGGFMMVPCGVCPIYQDCRVGGVISPATCEYMKKWLNF